MRAHTAFTAFRTARTSLKRGRMALALGTVILTLVVSPLATAEPGRITTLALSPQDGTLWVGTAQGLFRSGDQGRTLTPVTLPGAATSREVTAVAVAPASSKAVYVATAGEGIFRSEDGGRTWAAANQGLDALDVRGLALSPTDGRLHAQVRGKGLFRSSNGARTWERVDNGPAGVLYTLASVNISTGMGGIFLYAATEQGLVRGPD